MALQVTALLATAAVSMDGSFKHDDNPHRASRSHNVKRVQIQHKIGQRSVKYRALFHHGQHPRHRTARRWRIGHDLAGYGVR